MYHPDTKSYSAEISELSHGGMVDPWGHLIAMGMFKPHYDNGEDVTHWTFTAIRGGDKTYLLTIYND